MNTRLLGLAALSAAVLAAPASATSLKKEGTGCSVQAVVIEQYAANGASYARLEGLGNCGLGNQPTFAWKNVSVRESGKVRYVKLKNDYQVSLRLRTANSVVRGTFQIIFGTSSSSCRFSLSRNNYEQICS